MVGPLLHANSHMQPQVRVVFRVGINEKEMLSNENDCSSIGVCYLSSIHEDLFCFALDVRTNRSAVNIEIINIIIKFI